VDTKNQTDSDRSLVIGGTGLVGGYVVEQLLRRGQRPMAMSRSPHSKSDIEWIYGDLRKPDEFELPPFATLYCTAHASLLASALPRLLNPSSTRVITFSSTS
jgi:nucleoside-diphosphate-sugar epimerase